MTLVGTLRKNKPDIPPDMLPQRNRALLSSIFGFNGKITLVSYVQKQNAAVLSLSTMHHDAEVVGEQQKQAIITHYNGTKSGT